MRQSKMLHELLICVLPDASKLIKDRRANDSTESKEKCSARTVKECGWRTISRINNNKLSIWPMQLAHKQTNRPSIQVYYPMIIIRMCLRFFFLFFSLPYSGGLYTLCTLCTVYSTECLMGAMCHGDFLL